MSALDRFSPARLVSMGTRAERPAAPPPLETLR
jgi:hypothetical protein